MGNKGDKEKNKNKNPTKPVEKNPPEGTKPPETKPAAQSNVTSKELKIFIIGDFGVGKTSLAIKFTRDKFDEEMCKMNSQVSHADLDPMQGGKKKDFPVNDSFNASITHFDTAGNEKFRSATITPFAEANIIFICFAINNSESFNQLAYWHREAINNTTDKKPLVVLVGTKQDLSSDRRISQEDAEKFCKSQNNLLYFEVSAKTGYNVKELYTSACNELIKKVEKGEIPNPFEDDDD